jgi:hypothetical protein
MVGGLRDCTEADGQHFKSSLLVLMTCSSDLVALSKIVSTVKPVLCVSTVFD